MVVCKFFQQGNCRYGQNCRFEHAYSSKYTYTAAASHPQQDYGAVPVKDEQLVNQVQSDVQSLLRGGQWLLSAYAPFKEKPIFPGITDLSPEEARLFIYEAKANNNLEQAVSYMNNLFSEARQKYEMLLQKNQSIVNILRSLYKGEAVSSPFDNAPAGATPTSIFRGAVQSNSPFSQNSSPSIFGQNNSSTSHNDPAKSIFAQANNNVFSNNQSSVFSQQNPPTSPNQSIFNQQQSVFSPSSDANPKSIFAQATQNYGQSAPPTNVFAPSPPVNVFASPQNTFGPSQPTNPASLFANASQTAFSQNTQNQSSPFQQNVFQQSDNRPTFGVNQNSLQQNRVDDAGVYSKMDDLTPEQLDAFKSDDFKMGFVPELPPPHSLCF